eukprot:snap_masked-scaffold_37-processed-gene-2.43-mRNA-1 protein AED:1.00 eAED:1.00 QI:0/0/0/0/1/1/3/0/246
MKKISLKQTEKKGNFHIKVIINKEDFFSIIVFDAVQDFNLVKQMVQDIDRSVQQEVLLQSFTTKLTNFEKIFLEEFFSDIVIKKISTRTRYPQFDIFGGFVKDMFSYADEVTLSFLREKRISEEKQISYFHFMNNIPNLNKDSIKLILEKVSKLKRIRTFDPTFLFYLVKRLPRTNSFSSLKALYFDSKSISSDFMISFGLNFFKSSLADSVERIRINPPRKKVQTFFFDKEEHVYTISAQHNSFQ